MKDIIAGDNLVLVDAGELGDEIGTIKVLYVAPKPLHTIHKEK